ncbi:MAG: hypothetical protein V1748_01705 [Actinomycetota bacterium]
MSIGVGIETPPLVVADLGAPNSFVMPRGAGLAVTPLLLMQDLSHLEVESVMADGVAKIVLEADSKNPLRPRGAPDGDPMIPTEVRKKYDLHDWPYSGRTDIVADTLAARITSQPLALISAINKISVILGEYRVTIPFGLSPPMMFVPFSLAGIRERIENLERLERGVREPHQEVRDGRPTLMPEAWD